MNDEWWSDPVTSTETAPFEPWLIRNNLQACSRDIFLSVIFLSFLSRPRCFTLRIRVDVADRLR